MNVSINIVDSRTDRNISIIVGSLAIISICLGFLVFISYNWYLRARHGYSSKYVKNVFGTGAKDPSNYEAEETVALLTIGLKHMFPHMPQRVSRYQSVAGSLF